ncbi:hypothetical protein FEZ51_04125 [Pediococcus stilesii]|uniref:Uncharacterized protein n=1 Tax=Pediococcus stilesii TaxID=331679 RepID=A0A5R9BY89_9LACO|nr:hypothetical protein [Pediococcus stilesii]TLQ04832.1 hypothetical protein FEZ51_04125 [Pediococcus stilesii]
MDKILYNTWRNFLISHTFSFGKQNSSVPYTTEFKFDLNGNISGYRQNNESHWELLDDKLILKNKELDPTTEFILPHSFEFGIQDKLIGNFLRNTSIKHELMAISENGSSVISQDRSPELVNFLEDKLNGLLQKSAYLQSLNVNKTNSTIHIAFIINSVETLPALLPLIRAVIIDKRFEVKILAMNKLFDIHSLNTINSLTNFLDEQKLPYIKILGNFKAELNSLRIWNPNFIVRQSEWDADFPRAFSVQNLSWSHLIHIPYTVTEDFIYSAQGSHETLLTNPYYQNVWRYFIPEKLDPRQINSIQRSFVSLDCFSEVGSMKAIMIRNASPYWPFPKSKRVKVVWMAHHSIGDNWFNMGLFPKVYKPFLRWIASHSEIELVFNPHPLLEENIRNNDSKDISSAEYKSFLTDLEALPNALIFKNKNQYSLTAAADVILTDGISSIYEMQIQEKKIIAMIRPDHVPFTPHGQKLLTGTVTANDNPVEILAKLEKTLDSANSKRLQELQNTAKWLRNEQPEKLIIDEMINEIKK